MNLEMAIDPFEGRGNGRESEVEVKVDVAVDENVERALADYLSLFGIDDHYPFREVKTKVVLQPSKIEQFFQLVAGDDDYFPTFLGPFISRLIHNSYGNGHNDFRFSLPTRPFLESLRYFPFDLFGRSPEDMIKVTLDGDTDIYPGIRMRNVEFEVLGKYIMQVEDASSSVYDIKGRVYHCPVPRVSRVSDCTFIVDPRDYDYVATALRGGNASNNNKVIRR